MTAAAETAETADEAVGLFQQLDVEAEAQTASVIESQTQGV